MQLKAYTVTFVYPAPSLQTTSALSSEISISRRRALCYASAKTLLRVKLKNHQCYKGYYDVTAVHPGKGVPDAPATFTFTRLHYRPSGLSPKAAKLIPSTGQSELCLTKKENSP